MKLVSIDIETTGVDEGKDQILEFAAVCFDPQPALVVDGHVNESGRRWTQFECLVGHDRYEGSAFALSMNSDILAELSGRKETYREILSESTLMQRFYEWLTTQGFKGSNKAFIAGKNYGVFDHQFLKRIPGWTHLPIHRRILDPASLLFNPEDGKLLNLKECLAKVGIRKEISHRAIDDARDVATVITQFFR